MVMIYQLLCFCSHYQDHIIGYAIKLSTRAFRTKIKGFRLCLFWWQWLPLGSSLGQRCSPLRDSEGSPRVWHCLLPTPNPCPLCTPYLYALPGHGTSLGTCIYADTGYHLLRSEKRQCYLQFSLSFIEMNCLKYVSFGIVSSSCNFAAISPGWVQLQGREAILALSQRDLTGN